MDHRSTTTSSIPGQQALGLPQAHTQHARRRDTVVRRPASTSVKTSTRCKSCLLICTQPNLSPPTLISGWGSDTLALQSYDIIAVLAHIW
jgi:hypothetical protein